MSQLQKSYLEKTSWVTKDQFLALTALVESKVSLSDLHGKVVNIVNQKRNQFVVQENRKATIIGDKITTRKDSGSYAERARKRKQLYQKDEKDADSGYSILLNGNAIPQNVATANRKRSRKRSEPESDSIANEYSDDAQQSHSDSENTSRRLGSKDRTKNKNLYRSGLIGGIDVLPERREDKKSLGNVDGDKSLVKTVGDSDNRVQDFLESYQRFYGSPDIIRSKTGFDSPEQKFDIPSPLPIRDLYELDQSKTTWADLLPSVIQKHLDVWNYVRGKNIEEHIDQRLENIFAAFLGTSQEGPKISDQHTFSTVIHTPEKEKHSNLFSRKVENMVSSLVGTQIVKAQEDMQAELAELFLRETTLLHDKIVDDFTTHPEKLILAPTARPPTTTIVSPDSQNPSTALPATGSPVAGTIPVQQTQVQGGPFVPLSEFEEWVKVVEKRLEDPTSSLDCGLAEAANKNLEPRLLQLEKALFLKGDMKDIMALLDKTANEFESHSNLLSDDFNSKLEVAVSELSTSFDLAIKKSIVNKALAASPNRSALNANGTIASPAADNVLRLSNACGLGNNTNGTGDNTTSSPMGVAPPIPTELLARYVWRGTDFETLCDAKRGTSFIPWEVELKNTGKENFTRVEDMKFITVRDPGLYCVSCAMFGGHSPKLRVYLNSRMQLEKYLEGVEPQEAMGVSISEYLILEADAQVSLQFTCGNKDEDEYPPEGFLELRKL